MTILYYILGISLYHCMTALPYCIKKESTAFFGKTDTLTIAKDSSDSFFSKKALGMQDTVQPTIYLTFDDGPVLGSRVVANIARLEHIPISFFMVGMHYEKASPYIARLYQSLLSDRFFQILNHSYSHAYKNKYAKFYSDIEGAVNDIIKNQSALSLTSNIVRLPGSNAWKTPYVSNRWRYQKTSTIVDSLYKQSFYIMGWDAEWKFNYKTLKITQDSTSMMRIVHETMANRSTKLPNHLVLLMHERSFRDAKDSTSLASFIRMCKRSGYRFGYATNHPYFLTNR